MTTTKKLSVVYSSGINVWDTSYLNTLSVFYDRIWLPYTEDNSMEKAVAFLRKSKRELYKLNQAEVDRVTIFMGGEITTIGGYARDWANKYDLLFKEGVLARLPKPVEEVELRPFIPDKITKLMNEIFLDLPDVFQLSTTDGNQRLFIYQDLFRHFLRKDIDLPSLFTAQSNAPSRETLKFLMANTTFKFLLPKIGNLGVDEVLKLRKSVADTREGFAMHLQQLSEDVEKRVKEGDSLEDIARYAQSVVETKLEPIYREFVRQFKAKPTGIWGNIFDANGKVIEALMAPSLPQVIALLFKALGSMAGIASKQTMDELTNRNQAYQFMRSVEQIAE